MHHFSQLKPALTPKFTDYRSSALVIMTTASRVASVIFRVFELISAAVVLGISSRFIRVFNSAPHHGSLNGRIIYTEVIAAISIVLSILLGPPLIYSFYAFPVDFALFCCWIVAFGLLENVECLHPAEMNKPLTRYTAHARIFLLLLVVLQLLGVLLGQILAYSSIRHQSCCNCLGGLPGVAGLAGLELYWRHGLASKFHNRMHDVFSSFRSNPMKLTALIGGICRRSETF